jgi:hypothetical protein
MKALRFKMMPGMDGKADPRAAGDQKSFQDVGIILPSRDFAKRLDSPLGLQSIQFKRARSSRFPSICNTSQSARKSRIDCLAAYAGRDF